MKQYEFKVTVEHYVTFTEQDLADDAAAGGTSDPKEFALQNWGGAYETDIDTVRVELYDESEVEF